MAKGFKTKLDKMKEMWDKRSEAPGVPEGKYNLQLQSCILDEAKSSGNLLIKREHLVTSGEYEGEVIKDMMALQTEMGPYFVAKFIDQMGYESPDNPADLPDTLAAIEGEAPCYTANVKRSGEFTNVNIEELIEGEGEGKDDPPESGSGGGGEEEKKPAAKKVSKKPSTSEIFEKGTAVTFNDDDGNAMEGIVDSYDEKDDEYMVEVDDNLWAVPKDNVTSLETTGNGGEGSSDDDTKIALLEFATAWDVKEVTDSDSVEEIIGKLKSYNWVSGELTDEEKTLLGENEIELS